MGFGQVKEQDGNTSTGGAVTSELGVSQLVLRTKNAGNKIKAAIMQVCRPASIRKTYMCQAGSEHGLPKWVYEMFWNAIILAQCMDHFPL